MSDTLVVQISGSGQPTCSAGNEMVSQVARAVGGEDENSVRAQALDSINNVRAELDMHNLQFMKRTLTPATLLNGIRTYSLGSTFKSQAYMRLFDANSKPYSDLGYVDDATLNHFLPQQTATGLPTLYSVRNSFNDGLISVYPVPGASEAAVYTLGGEFYTRMPEILDDPQPMQSITEEACAVIIAGAKYLIVGDRDKTNTARIAQLFSDYQRMKQLLITSDRRVQDETARFRIAGRRRVTLTADQILGTFP